ncbi:uncharacterized protein LOC121969738 [Zingiber officinale]|uniref:uncharacterized protein LOC121969738 n=1 Tax=Zingiber officinale TaxID=94328 RepID=UPI001C4C86CF|nr:uncharacterized protein LOC121969738 [Zingiber officinale]
MLVDHPWRSSMMLGGHDTATRSRYRQRQPRSLFNAIVIEILGEIEMATTFPPPLNVVLLLVIATDSTTHYPSPSAPPSRSPWISPLSLLPLRRTFLGIWRGLSWLSTGGIRRRRSGSPRSPLGRGTGSASGSDGGNRVAEGVRRAVVELASDLIAGDGISRFRPAVGELELLRPLELRVASGGGVGDRTSPHSAELESDNRNDDKSLEEPSAWKQKPTGNRNPRLNKSGWR